MTSWLITGGTGSFGKAYTRALLDGGADRVVIYSRDELKQAEMRAEFDDPRLRFFIGSVDDYDRLVTAMSCVDRVVHAAAMKRVETCEENPFEATRTNVIGTACVARACMAAGVEKAVLLSTDKAVAPNTLYGTTKLAAERIWIRANVYSAHTWTRFSATRYGNVIGSRGSVVPIFKKQAAAGGPLTITDPRMTRFLMRMEEAVSLVDLAFNEMRSGEIFIPKIRGTTIPELASVVGPGLPQAVTGIRPGEKLHESLLGDDEVRQTWDYGDHYRIEPVRTWEDETVALVDCTKVPDDFVYRSDVCEQFTPDALWRLVA